MIVIAVLVFSAATMYGQQLCDFGPTQTSPTNQWTDKTGSYITNWTGSANYEITTSNISVTSGPNPYVLHCDPVSGPSGYTPQWTSTYYGFFNWASAMEWTFWMGRRQGGGNTDVNRIWLFVDQNTGFPRTSNGRTGFYLTWQRNNSVFNVYLVKSVSGSESTLISFVLNDDSDFPWGCAFSVSRVPVGNDATWSINVSTLPMSNPGYSSSSVSAQTNPFVAATNWRGSYTEINAMNPGQAGYITVWSDFTNPRKEAAEYNQICLDIATPVPVELTSFHANRRNEQTYLSWHTATETNNYGFEIQRTLLADEWETIGFVDGNGTTNAPHRYNYVDDEILAGGVARYRLKQIDRDGTFHYSSIVNVRLNADSPEMVTNFPNPFNPSTTISFNLIEDDWVTLRVFDASGQLIRTLYEAEDLRAGAYSVTFDGTELPSGTYVYRLETTRESQTGKMILTK